MAQCSEIHLRIHLLFGGAHCPPHDERVAKFWSAPEVCIVLICTRPYTQQRRDLRSGPSCVARKLGEPPPRKFGPRPESNESERDLRSLQVQVASSWCPLAPWPTRPRKKPPRRQTQRRGRSRRWRAWCRPDARAPWPFSTTLRLLVLNITS